MVTSVLSCSVANTDMPPKYHSNEGLVPIADSARGRESSTVSPSEACLCVREGHSALRDSLHPMTD